MRLALPIDSLPRLWVSLASFATAIVPLIWLGGGLASARSSPRVIAESLPTISSLSIEPSSILLHGSNRQQQILVTAKVSSSPSIDVTHRCEISSSDPAVASMSGTVVWAVGNGTAEIRVRLGVNTATVPVRVRDSDRFPPVHFANDVMPLFSKFGCNSAGCHGKASGQNGFKLSVFGFDPDADYSALVKEARGRRVFPGCGTWFVITPPSGGRAPDHDRASAEPLFVEQPVRDACGRRRRGQTVEGHDDRHGADLGEFSLESMIAHERGHQLIARHERLKRIVPTLWNDASEEILASLLGSLLVDSIEDEKNLLLKAMVESIKLGNDLESVQDHFLDIRNMLRGLI